MMSEKRRELGDQEHLFAGPCLDTHTSGVQGTRNGTRMAFDLEDSEHNFWLGPSHVSGPPWGFGRTAL